jgi:hypothetical protein
MAWACFLTPFAAGDMIACAHNKKVIRDGGTFQLEVQAALARQQEASTALKTAAERAREAGQHEYCVEYATPALLIDAYAESQANRALWLAGLVDGEDPGPSAEPKPATTLCGDPQ